MQHGLIYKPGEGYWIRVMTLAMILIITLTSAAWAFASIDALGVYVPAKSWDLVLTGFAGETPPGQEVTLLTAKGTADGVPVQIGTAQVVERVSTGGADAVVRITNPPLPGNASVLDVENQSVRIGGASALVSSVRAVPAFEILYVQIAAAAVLVVAGAWCAYWFVGRSRGAVEFLIATDAEMRKVNWSTRREILGSTYVVIGATLLVALSLFLIDYAFSEAFKAIRLLVVD